jgi:hypothetical protein
VKREGASCLEILRAVLLRVRVLWNVTDATSLGVQFMAFRKVVVPHSKIPESSGSGAKGNGSVLGLLSALVQVN